jgi:hypothetical protein
MKMNSKRIREIIREEVDALDFFNGINQENGGLTAWNPETKMERMQPSNASRANYMPPKKDFRLHSYDDWVKNYKPKGISYKDYIDTVL